SRSTTGNEWFSRVMGILGKGKKTDDERFSQVHQAVEAVAQSQADLTDQFSATAQESASNKQAIAKLTADLAAMKQQVETTDGNFSRRPPAGGGGNVQQADY
ncbi:GPO family capsid scaffolding protein, partial [Serratia marcescens]